MPGICNTCKYFKADVHSDENKPHHCNFQNVALSEPESHNNCDECIPRDKNGKSCCH